jgi:hypothetical protein
MVVQFDMTKYTHRGTEFGEEIPVIKRNTLGCARGLSIHEHNYIRHIT